MIPEAIGELVADIRAGRTHHPAAVDESGVKISMQMLLRAQRPQPVVDCTAIFKEHQSRDAIALYDDHPVITPPWPDAFLCYINTFGNTIGLQVHLRSWTGTRPDRADWYTDNEVDWSRVRWVAETAVWVGGRSGDGRYMPTSGPCHLFRHAIYEDGSPGDINWLALLGPRGRAAERKELGDPNQSVWDAAMITLGGSLNFLNCRNVDIAEPHRPRPQRRRLERLGVQVQTIVVRPPGRRRSGQPAEARPIDSDETLFSPVRGRFAHYGPRYNRGLLFGKYEGRFWVAPHVRGKDKDGGEQRDYVLRPNRAASGTHAG